jgi:hypothetical protein
MAHHVLLSVMALMLLIAEATSQQQINTTAPVSTSNAGKGLAVVQKIAHALNSRTSRQGGAPRKGKGQPCMDYVRSLPYPRYWLAQLKPDSRPLPDINQPNIGYGDWDDSMKVSWEHGWVGP